MHQATVTAIGAVFQLTHPSAWPDALRTGEEAVLGRLRMGLPEEGLGDEGLGFQKTHLAQERMIC